MGVKGGTKEGWQGLRSAGYLGQEGGWLLGQWVGGLVLPRTDMPYTEWGPSGKVSKESCGEATEAEDEAEEPTALQFYSGKSVAVVARVAPP